MHDGKIITYASTQLKPYERDYLTRDLELAILLRYGHYLYRKTCKIYANH